MNDTSTIVYDTSARTLVVKCPYDHKDGYKALFGARSLRWDPIELLWRAKSVNVALLYAAYEYLKACSTVSSIIVDGISVKAFEFEQIYGTRSSRHSTYTSPNAGANANASAGAQARTDTRTKSPPPPPLRALSNPYKLVGLDANAPEGLIRACKIFWNKALRSDHASSNGEQNAFANASVSERNTLLQLINEAFDDIAKARYTK